MTKPWSRAWCRHVSAATHKQALSAILFLYKNVLEMQMPWLGDIGRQQTRIRMPVVLSREEVSRLLLGAVNYQTGYIPVLRSD